MSSDQNGVTAPRSLASNAAILIVAGAVTAVLQFAVGIALANTLTKSDFGTFKQVYLLFGIVTPLFSLALPGSLLYFIPRAREGERIQLVWQTLWTLAGFGLVLGAILWFSAPIWVRSFSNESIEPALRIFAFVPVFALPAAALPNVAVAVNRTRMAAVSSLALSLANLVLVGGASVAFRSLDVVLVLTVVSSAIQAVVALALCAAAVGGVSFSVHWRKLREQFSYAVPLALSGLVGLLAYQTDRLLVSLKFTPAQFAIYAIGAVEVPLVATVNSSVNSVLLPRISELHAQGRVHEIVSLYREAVRKTAVLIMPLFGFLMFMAREFITLLYPDYLASVPIFRVYLILLPLRVATYGLVLQATGETRSILRGSAYYLIGNAVISAGLMYVLGLVGPAWGTVVATVAIAAWYLATSGRSLGISAWKLMPWHDVGLLLAISTLGGWASIMVSSWLVQDNLARLAIASALMVVVYFGLGRAAGVVTANDVQRLLNWLARTRRQQS